MGKRKKRRLRGKAKCGPLPQFHEALGQFLTALGRVEIEMFKALDAYEGVELDVLLEETEKKTFGPRIDWFKEWCKKLGLTEAQKELVERIFALLDKLLPKRNFLVHGNSFVESFDGKNPKAYRVGVVRGDLNWLTKFDFGVHGDNVFTIEQIREAIKICNDLIAALEKLRGG
jgi:hypothetical protein